MSREQGQSQTRTKVAVFGVVGVNAAAWLDIKRELVLRCDDDNIAMRPLFRLSRLQLTFVVMHPAPK